MPSLSYVRVYVCVSQCMFRKLPLVNIFVCGSLRFPCRKKAI